MKTNTIFQGGLHVTVNKQYELTTYIVKKQKQYYNFILVTNFKN